MWWHANRHAKLVVALQSKEAVQNELNTMHNKKLILDKILEGTQAVHNSAVLNLTT